MAISWSIADGGISRLTLASFEILLRAHFSGFMLLFLLPPPLFLPPPIYLVISFYKKESIFKYLIYKPSSKWFLSQNLHMGSLSVCFHGKAPNRI